MVHRQLEVLWLLMTMYYKQTVSMKVNYNLTSGYCYVGHGFITVIQSETMVSLLWCGSTT